MSRNFFVAIVVASAGLLSTGKAQGAILSGAVSFSTDSNGNASGGQVWNTRPGDGFYNLWFTEGTPGALAPNNGLVNSFINGPSDANAGINVDLSTPGTYDFTIFGEPGANLGFEGLNLFFDGGVAPSISVKAAVRTGLAQPAFSANGGSTLTLAGGGVAGANALSFVDGLQTITLTNFYWAAPSFHAIDRVTPFSATPGGSFDFVGTFTLVVNSPIATTPEPSTALLCVLGLVCGGMPSLVRRRRRG